MKAVSNNQSVLVYSNNDRVNIYADEQNNLVLIDGDYQGSVTDRYSLLRLLILFEQPTSEIFKGITDDHYKLEDVLPFNELVIFLVKTMKSTYWFNLVYKFLLDENVGFKFNTYVIYCFRNQEIVGWLPQKERHMIRKLVSRYMFKECSMHEERKLLHKVTSFHFTMEDRDSFREILHAYCDDKTDNYFADYLRNGWREKLLAACCIAFLKREQYLKQIEEQLFTEVNGRQIKGYILAVVLLCRKEEAEVILNRYRLLKDISTELDWVNSALEYLADNRSSDEPVSDLARMKIAVEIFR